MKETILLVEDDANILRTNRRILEREGFNVLCADTLSEARSMLSEHTVDALVLDIMLPDGSGLAFCKEIRSSTSAPVLFLTALDEKSEIIEGLVVGGNDYITKPYDVNEFLARVNAHLRLAQMNRREAENLKILKRGPITMDMVALRASLNGEDMQISAREFSVLRYLLKNEGRIISAEELYKEAWSQPMIGNANALWKCISRLKNKLAAASEKVVFMSFRNQGYMLEIMEERASGEGNTTEDFTTPDLVKEK